MRDLLSIKNDIESCNKKLELLKRERNTFEDNENISNTFPENLFIICLCISMILVFLQFFKFGNNTDYTLIKFLPPLWFISLFLACITGNKELSERKARKFALIGLVLFVFCTVGVFFSTYFLMKNISLFDSQNVENLINSIVNANESSTFFSMRLLICWFLITAFSMIPVLIFFIRNILKYKKQKRYMAENSSKIAENEFQTGELEQKKRAYIQEMEYTTKECKRLFEEANSNNDIDGIYQLKKLNYSEARDWLRNYKKEQDENKGKKLYNEQIKLPNPDCELMINAAKLGYMKACIWVAEIYFYELTDLYNDGSLSLQEMQQKTDPIYGIVCQAATESALASVAKFYIEHLNENYFEYELTDCTKLFIELEKLLKSGKLNTKAINLCYPLYDEACTAVNHLRDERAREFKEELEERFDIEVVIE